MAAARGESNRNAMKLKIGQHDGESSEAKCNLQVCRPPSVTRHGGAAGEFEIIVIKKWEGKKKQQKTFIPLSIFLARRAVPSAATPWLASPRLKQPHFLSFSSQNDFFFFLPPFFNFCFLFLLMTQN